MNPDIKIKSNKDGWLAVLILVAVLALILVAGWYFSDLISFV
jgi:hypothetical protein